MAVAYSAREKNASLGVRLYARLVYTVTTSTSRAPEVAIFTTCTVPWTAIAYLWVSSDMLSFFLFFYFPLLQIGGAISWSNTGSMFEID
jgi:hypothetical protein